MVIGLARAPQLLTLSCCALLFTGCGGGGDGPSIFTTDTGVSTLGTTTNDETSGSGNTSAETPGDGDGDGDPGDGDGDPSQDDGPLFDISPQEAGDDGIPMDDQCAKVDVLYIIDNSPSMYEEQQTLIANFGNFVTDMQTALEGVSSYHVGVITSDDYQDGGWIDDGANTVNAQVPECQHLGGLVVQAHSGLCTPFAAGDNFITETDNLATKFECIANVGEDGDSDEYMGDALIALLAEGQQNTGCNANFLRPDAMLIIVMLTDENDSSGTNENQWFQAVVNAKGTEENVVVLSLIWDQGNNNCSNAFSETDGYQIEAFTEMFTNHAVGNICDDSYAGFFASAIPTIEDACDNFVPVE
ncbi:hypothetical protein [Enhygromyxa salina]|uniref:VWFA domain-containing protein n=1 Tax=Enhygromyxa salina TaxID=215803 RepID=A0A2S9YVU7_9BACT|nr:hypothetical protein [Enhygromyxa salina]PRQ09172.1 hypothetical protein ENSA7_11620 [Enhygromyxa salina]